MKNSVRICTWMNFSLHSINSAKRIGFSGIFPALRTKGPRSSFHWYIRHPQGKRQNKLDGRETKVVLGSGSDSGLDRIPDRMGLVSYFRCGTGAYEWEHATPLYFCHGVFIDRFIIGSCAELLFWEKAVLTMTQVDRTFLFEPPVSLIIMTKKIFPMYHEP